MDESKPAVLYPDGTVAYPPDWDGVSWLIIGDEEPRNNGVWKVTEDGSWERP